VSFFILVGYVHVRIKKVVSVCKDIGLLGVWFTLY